MEEAIRTEQRQPTIEVTGKARRELTKILKDKPGQALRLFIEGYG